MEGDISDLIKPVAWIVGRWESEKAAGTFPGIKDFSYKETLEFSIFGKQPLLGYTGRSSNVNNGNPMHLESGFLRSGGGNNLSFLVAHNFGLTTVEEGQVDGNQITLKSTNIGRMSNAKEPSVSCVERTFKLEGDKLVQKLSMATSKTPDVTSHLCVTYAKV